MEDQCYCTILLWSTPQHRIAYPRFADAAQLPLFPPPIPSPPSPALKNGGCSCRHPSVVIVALVLTDPVFHLAFRGREEAADLAVVGFSIPLYLLTGFATWSQAVVE